LILHILIQRYAKAAVVLSMVILSQRGNKWNLKQLWMEKIFIKQKCLRLLQW
jgi:hypothetical protein